MSIIDVKRDIYIASADDARAFLISHGIDEYQLDEFVLLLKFGEAVDIEFELNDLRDTVKHDEIYQDGLYTALVDAMNLADDLGRKARSKEARELLKAVHDNIFFSEVI